RVEDVHAGAHQVLPIRPHPAFGFSGQTPGVEAAALASMLDALHGVREHGEHEGPWARRVTVPPDTPGHLHREDSRRVAGHRVELSGHRSLLLPNQLMGRRYEPRGRDTRKRASD